MLFCNQIKRFHRLDEYIKKHDFDKLMLRLVDEHSSEHQKSFYERGEQPQINNKLNLLFDYVKTRCEFVENNTLESEYSNVVWKFKNYYFQIICGEKKIIHVIYNVDDLKEIINI